MPDTTTLPSSTELRGELEAAGARLRELRSTPEQSRGDSHAADLRDASNAVLDLDRLMSVAERSERHRMQEADWARAVTQPAQGPSAAFAPTGQTEPRTIGQALVADERYQELVNDGGDMRRLNVELRGGLVSGPNGPEFRALLDSDDGDGGLLRPVGQPQMVAQVLRRQRLFVRDLISVQTTGLATIPYIRELNPLTNETGATSVAEGAAKPEAVMEFEQYDAIVRKLAVWIPATTEILADAPTLRGYIDNRLAYMLALVEEKQVIDGNGTAPNLRGIRETTGTQTQSAVNNDVPATIAQAIAKVENVDGEADGVAMNPLDFWAAVSTRHANQFDNGFGGNAPAEMSSITWGLPVVRTRALATLNAIVGSWRLGATLFDRQQTRIDTSESHGDYFVQNKVAIRAEERVALAVHRPDFFVETTLDITA